MNDPRMGFSSSVPGPGQERDPKMAGAADKSTDAGVRALVDVALPDKKGAVPHPSGNSALDAALRDPEAAADVQVAMLGAGGTGFVTGAVVGGVAGIGLIGLAWALWPKGKSK